MGRTHVLKLGLVIVVVALVSVQFYVFPVSEQPPNPSSVSTLLNTTISSDIPKTSFVTRWILALWSPVVSDGRSVFESKKRTDILLLLRRLVVFSVREVNQRLEGTRCAKWWANPLSVTEFDEEKIDEGTIQYKVTFQIQPGAIPFRSVVKLSRKLPNATHRYYSSDLQLLNATRLDKTTAQNCSNSALTKNLAQICFCPEDTRSAEELTVAARVKWSKSDPELFSWPPNVSVSVPDYIRFSTMDLYIKSPSNKIQFSGPQVEMLLFISSAPTHFKQRNSIRNTFGNASFLEANRVKMVFLFGTVQESELQLKIDAEFHEYNDIVQADFEDSYHNLTLSHLSMYNWVVTNCKSSRADMPKWLLKADDDYFLNIPLAKRIAETNPEIEMIGISFCGTLAIRDVGLMKKYYVPRYMYAPDYYAGYLSGVAYLVRTDVLEHMLHASLTTPIIHMDDAYVMGLLTRELGIRPRNSRLITYTKANSPCDIHNMMNSHVTQDSTLESMWTTFKNSSYICDFDEGMLRVDQLTDVDSRFCMFS